ncbi:bifunctional diguanylate cyclase/phosphodiesterase [Vibrio pectenicida]|uniref:Bifunctional diguanylate cyclase/phosphodiesterase n=1 Tax=Vibrio pectenicida TaxID=62763 RepID=A0A7Y3ZYM5_9VIBR|nr:bifunctional diguanylate cyclase/phosphodiesterase [Vibrio pectenicida]NOH70869.1 bifunctional diguanylate cyclase/phosphodiesterase [Vibrio pectenicida]
MARTPVQVASMDLDVINHTLQLDGAELLDQVTNVLNQHFETYCTCIVEIDKFNSNGYCLSQACFDSKSIPHSYSLRSTPSFRVSHSQLDYLLYTQKVSLQFPEDTYIREHELEAYIGIPLKTASGEVLGVLLSTFKQPIENPKELIYYHILLANMVVHSLRVKWLAARSDSLVRQLSYEVSHDDLTGLLNRSYLSDKLERLAESHANYLALVYVDIDSFKSINNLYGQYIGDQVLKFVAHAIESSLHIRQFAFRISGDEFAFITYASDPIETCRLILAKLSAGYTDPVHNVKINVSMGIAIKSDHRVNAEQLILNASLALKDCKQSRKSQIRCYDTELSAQYYRRTRVIDALRKVLTSGHKTSNEIHVVAQPIVKLGQEHWYYFEILARWESRSLGFISPTEFIEAAEQSGLIVDLGERIFELTCWAKKQLETGLGHKVKLGINCSAHELNDPHRYLTHITSTIGRYGFKPEEFTIELTETVLLTQASEIGDILNKMRQLGFCIALDDFGTGYSSLNYIHRYPIDCIKIDASFIRNMFNNPTSERLIWLIIQLAKQLKVDLVAEGAETQQAVDKLHQMGCAQIQGYYYSRPQKPEAIIEAQNNIGPTEPPPAVITC